MGTGAAGWPRFGPVGAVMLVDGNSLAYRAFFALPTDMATASGQVTNAVYGFTSMLINLWRDHRPDQIAVAFDRPEPTFRHQRVATYKANRHAAPDILRQQMGLVREVIDALALPTLEMAGYEADDIIATLATEGRDAGRDVIIVTGDRDAYQLVEDPHVKVLYNKRGVSEYALYDEAGIAERTGVAPARYVEYAALRGDPSDNLPGVGGVGDKRAAQLVNEHDGLDGIFAGLDSLTPKLRQNLAEAEAQVRTNAEVMTLVRDVPLGVGLADLAAGEIDREAVRKLFDFLEFRSLHDRLAEVLGDAPSAPAAVLEAAVEVFDTAAQAAAGMRAAAGGSGLLAVAPAPGGIDEGFAFVADSAAGRAGFVPGRLLVDSGGEDGGGEADAASALAEMFGPGGPPLAMHGAKPFLRDLVDRGVDPVNLRLDTMLAAYLLDPSGDRYDLAEMLPRFTGLELPESDAPSGQLDFDLDAAAATPAVQAARAALAVDRLAAPLREALAAQGLADLHDDVEAPLVRVLARMEHIGIGVDPAVLTRIRDELAAETEEMRAAVIAAAGREFNLNSPKQLREVLFDELGLTPLKRTKTGYSTDAQSLERLREAHPVVEHLLDYRELEKLRSTYGEGLLGEVGPGDRIRATFNQTVARTGRLSSDAPNLHNIPVRSERGRVFRTAFVAPEGRRLLVADYDQIELRCIAHLASDPGLIAAFEAGDDIHTATAARVFGADPAEVGVEQRSRAKMISYGLAYGMEAYGLAQRLNIATEEAAVILGAYFEAFPAVRDYMDRTVAEARRRGYTETLFGRRRQIPELASQNARIRQAGERQAMNAGIQGLAADIFKVALVRLDAALDDGGLASRIVLQVHDEIIVESPAAEVEAASELARATMGGAFELKVPLEVDLQVAETWAGAKG